MRKKWKWFLLLLLIVLLAGAGYYGYSLYNFANNISNKSEQNSYFSKEQQQENLPPIWEKKDRVNILLLGGDARVSTIKERPRSDTMILLSVDPVTKKASMMSILRDLYVKIPGKGQNRINAALAFGGPNLAMRTVSEALDIPVQYYVYTDFKGFIALVDSIGGVTIDVEKNMKYTDSADKHLFDINLKKGVQQMDGKTALQYVRFRHDAEHNIGRSERQRKFISAVAQKMQSTSSILKMPTILNNIEPFIETNLKVSDLTKLAGLAFEVNTKEMSSVQLPPMHLYNDRMIEGMAVVTTDKKKLQQYVQGIFNGTISPDGKPVNK
ncbi:LCP family protein [Paenibacillus sp. N1-5-1-14]|uniref:LCP family protein n=1 Tax=Paenibacillus radicibacter TaxID=2972488 RepID=UPI0021596C87|nr:LCP family protein [Paenibacillus radicibacter]MCR8643040.1 LCP family protein [Paenibacillus radicibacter]